MNEKQVKEQVMKELDKYNMSVSDEDLTIIMGNVENWLMLTGCPIKEAVKHTLNYEDPWSEY